MRLTILGGDGGWPRPGGACSGYLVQHEGCSVLIDPGPGTFPRLAELLPVTELDAVLVSHGHPDHVLDLNPLLRARAFIEPPAPALPVFAPAAALDPVLGLDRPGVIDDAVEARDLASGEQVAVGPFGIDTAELPHTWSNLALRISAGDETLVYTGDSGPSPARSTLSHAGSTYCSPRPATSTRCRRGWRACCRRPVSAATTLAPRESGCWC